MIKNGLAHGALRTEPDMGNQKNKSIITGPTTHGRDAGKGLMNQENSVPAVLTDSSETADTVSLNKKWVGQKLISAEKWTN